MTPREKLEVKVGKENADKWIKMIQEGIKPEQVNEKVAANE